ncbi:MAG TPA: hypothetical protein VFT12_14205 [Thermoanaerobaculia bacterium]|nr:hypothetical protein [Thermoanaerobaculia bacterium]
MSDPDQQEQRILAVAGDDEDTDAGSQRWFAHLTAKLALPCEVTGKEDFRWEEPYLLGSGTQKEYQRLCRDQPSFEDVYSLEGIELTDEPGEWALRPDDISAHVRRTKDGKEFVLGLSELSTVDEDSANATLLDDYAMWFWNSR